MYGRCSIHARSTIQHLRKQHLMASNFDFLSLKPYTPPSWASHLDPIPSHIVSLAHLPTPIHRWNLPNLPPNTEVWLKRDDLSGMQLSGNKVRKLEFLMADAVAEGADSVITIGGIQSNHCRATAVAAKYLNLDPFLILRTSKLHVDQDPALVGNLLVERLVGARLQLISKEEYAQIGSVTLANLLKQKLIKEGRRPYVIPVGGSNPLGTWGYIEAIREIELQIQSGTSNVKFDDIVVACGSGGTIAGLALGSSLSTLKARVHAFSVCDDPDYFHNFVQGLLDGLKAGVNSGDIVQIQNAKGLGYAMNTSEELNFVKEVAEATGVVLDPVYSGKAAYAMLKDMNENPKKWEGRKILFVHTGGLLGLYPLSSLETTLLVCNNNNKKKKKESDSQTKRFPIDGTSSLTAPLPPSQLLGKVKDFLGVMSEANKRLENDAKDHPEEYDIEELTGNESEVIEMDLMLGVADLHTPEAVAAAESAISGCQPVISLAADGSETDSEEQSSVDEDDEIDSNVDECDYENDGKKPSSLDKKHTSDKDCVHEKQKENRRSKKRPAIVELS